MPHSSPLGRAWLAAVPGLFVLLWSTGFIGAKFGLPYAEPMTFLFIRMVLTLALLVPLAMLLRAPWPGSWTLAGHIAVTGVLVHGVYLGGVFTSIHWKLPAGISALIVGLQPLITACLAGPLLGERVSGRQWLGFVLGLGGVAMVLGEKVAAQADVLSGFGWPAVAMSLAALLGITAGTMYQKRHCTGMNLVTGTVVQYLAAGAFFGVNALLWETREIRWTGEFVFALGWLVVVLSVAAIMLLMFIIRRGEVSRVASLFYLVPPVTAVEAYLLFGERLGPVALVGMAVAVAGVALVVVPSSQRR